MADEQLRLLLTVIVGVIILLVVRARLAQRRPSKGKLALRQTGTGGGASLYMVSGPGQGRRMQIGNNPMYIGRLPSNQIQIDGPLVSRQHAVIERAGAGWRIRDLNSTNGTWINNRQIDEYTLQSGDRIHIGPSVLAFQIAGMERTPSPQPSIAVAERRPPPGMTTAAKIHDLRDYDLTEIGRGGEGVVYRGISRTDGSVMAIKILESEDPYLAQKFQQVGEMGTRLRHPNIATIHRFGREHELYYIFMEYVDGGSLRDQLHTETPYSFSEATRILGETSEALDYAHRQKFVHRDIKPSNILLTHSGQTKLSDFGIAKIMSAPSITQDGLLLGTPEYMSYEQAKGQPVEPKSDIYSLGIVAYQLFSGRLPFVSNGSEQWRLLDMHLREEPRPPRQINPGIPPNIERAILRAMDKDIKKRFNTCADFARAIGYTPASYTKGNAANTATSAHLLLETGEIIPITGPDFLINRETLGGQTSVSRARHARIIFRDGAYWLNDEGSTNGTFRNGQLVRDWLRLQANDTLTFGRVSARFLFGP